VSGVADQPADKPAENRAHEPKEQPGWPARPPAPTSLLPLWAWLVMRSGYGTAEPRSDGPRTGADVPGGTGSGGNDDNGVVIDLRGSVIDLRE
jgi:hypothetical protein